MADQHASEGSSGNTVSAGSSDSTLQLNIKTLDSRIYSFQAEKNMLVSLFKEKIANEIGLPVNQQRLIFRGKVLKDDHPLSEYHVENGDTLHLVERQPTQSASTGSAEASSNNGMRGNDAPSGAPRNRAISHSVVLGTFNVGDQGEGIVPDLTRVIGAVLNSIGIGSQAVSNVINPTQSSSMPNLSVHAAQGNEREGANVSGLNQSGNQAPSGQSFSSQPFQSEPQVVQIPLAAGAIPIPSLHAPIPDSLSTLSEFMRRMEQTLSDNGYTPNSSSSGTGEPPQVQLNSNAQGLPTLESLSTVLRHAEWLLSAHAVTALSHIARRLEHEGASSDPSIRSQIQSESMQVGIAMQHLGALLLELGRSVLTLRMGQSPAEFVVNAGPAVYISSSGPNPIMVQPFPLQTSSLFGGSIPSSTPATTGQVDVGTAPRNINIHIHAGTALAPIVSAIGSRPSNEDGMQSERRNVTNPGDSGSTRILPIRIAATVPSRATGAMANASQPGLGVSLSQPSSNSDSISSAVAELNSRIRHLVAMQGNNPVPSGQADPTGPNLTVESESQNSIGEEQCSTGEIDGPGASNVPPFECLSGSRIHENHPEPEQTSNYDETGLSSSTDSSMSAVESAGGTSGGTATKLDGDQKDCSTSNEEKNLTEDSKSVPLGLGMGGLELKRHGKQKNTQAKVAGPGASSSSVNQNQHSRTGGQHLFQTLANIGSAPNQMNASQPTPGQFPSTDGQIDLGSVMSQALCSPALNGLLAGVSEQTGVGSPDALRNMLQQFTQSPQMMSAVNQIAQQVGSQDLGNMMSGIESSQGGGIDLSRMFQQMMPIVSRALGSGPVPSPPLSGGVPEPQMQHIDGMVDIPELHSQHIDGMMNRPNEQNIQIDLQRLVQMIQHQNPPPDVFRAVVENASELYGNSGSDDLVDELCSNDRLVHDYMEMLRRDVHQRLEGNSRLDEH